MARRENREQKISLHFYFAFCICNALRKERKKEDVVVGIVVLLPTKKNISLLNIHTGIHIALHNAILCLPYYYGH